MTAITARNCTIAGMLGIAVACADLFADNGELSPPVILLLFAVAGGLTVAVQTRYSLRLLLLVAIWLPAAIWRFMPRALKRPCSPTPLGQFCWSELWVSRGYL